MIRRETEGTENRIILVVVSSWKSVSAFHSHVDPNSVRGQRRGHVRFSVAVGVFRRGVRSRGWRNGSWRVVGRRKISAVWSRVPRWVKRRWLLKATHWHIGAPHMYDNAFFGSTRNVNVGTKIHYVHFWKNNIFCREKRYRYTVGIYMFAYLKLWSVFEYIFDDVVGHHDEN